jgi:transposase
VAVLDRGYFSAANLKLLAEHGCKALIPVPGNNALFRDARRQYGKRVRMAENAFTVSGDTMYGIAFDAQFEGRGYQAFFYYNASRKADEEHRFYRLIEKAERAFEEEKPMKRKDAVALLYNSLPPAKAKFLKIELAASGHWRITRKPKAIARHLNGLGFMLLLSDAEYAMPSDALDDYRSRDAVEKLIDNMKNALNDDRLRIHSSAAADGKLFLMLVAMTLHSAMQRSLAPSAKSRGRRISPREALLALRRIKSSPCGNGTILVAEIARREREIIRLLGVPLTVFASTST